MAETRRGLTIEQSVVRDYEENARRILRQQKEAMMEQHETNVAHGVDWFFASCSCGWIGSSVVSRGAAENDATDHVVAVTV